MDNKKPKWTIDRIISIYENNLKYLVYGLCGMFLIILIPTVIEVRSIQNERERKETPEVSIESEKQSELILGNCEVCGKTAKTYAWVKQEDKMNHGHHVKMYGQEVSEIVCGYKCDLAFREQLMKTIENEKSSGLGFSNKCGLCSGTGIEKNTASTITGDDSYGRICPLCNGTGKK